MIMALGMDVEDEARKEKLPTHRWNCRRNIDQSFFRPRLRSDPVERQLFFVDISNGLNSWQQQRRSFAYTQE
jgi:hypothetical protein